MPATNANYFQNMNTSQGLQMANWGLNLYQDKNLQQIGSTLFSSNSPFMKLNWDPSTLQGLQMAGLGFSALNLFTNNNTSLGYTQASIGLVNGAQATFHFMNNAASTFMKGLGGGLALGVGAFTGFESIANKDPVGGFVGFSGAASGAATLFPSYFSSIGATAAGAALAGGAIGAGAALFVSGITGNKPVQTVIGTTAMAVGAGYLAGGVGALASAAALGGFIGLGIAALVAIFGSEGRGEERQGTERSIVGKLAGTLKQIKEMQQSSDPQARAMGNQMLYDIMKTLHIPHPEDLNISHHPEFNENSKGQLANGDLINEDRMDGTIQVTGIDSSGKVSFKVKNKFNVKTEATTDELHALNGDLSNFQKKQTWVPIYTIPSTAYGGGMSTFGFT